MKSNQSSHKHHRAKSSFELGAKPVSKTEGNMPVRYPNGDLKCRVWGDRIDLSVRITRSVRQPGKCCSCPFNL